MERTTAAQFAGCHPGGHCDAVGEGHGWVRVGCSRSDAGAVVGEGNHDDVAGGVEKR